MSDGYSSSSDESYHEGDVVAMSKSQGDIQVDLASPNKSTGPIANESKRGLQSVEEGLADIPDMEKGTMNELLLSVQNLGTPSGSGGFVRGEDCILWLGDIQRVLARDDLDIRHVHNVLGSLKVLPKYLIPLMKLSKDDDELTLSMLKIFALLTTPMTPSVIKDASVKINPKTASPAERDIKEKKQKIALKQFENLLSNKECFIDKDLVGLIVAWMQNMLRQSGTRSEVNGLNIELVLTLVRNCLAMECISSSSSKRMSDVHDQLVKVFHEEHMLEIILLFALDIESRENKMLNIILMEIIHYMTQNLDPEIVAAAYVGTPQVAPRNRGPSLKQLAQVGRSSLPASSRHTHFGGAVRVAGSGGRAAHVATNVNTVNHRDQPAVKFQRSKLAFNSSQRSERTMVGRHTPCETDVVVANFCRTFLKDSFSGFMKSVKTEFRVESMRLHLNDKIVLFKLTRFFLALQRHVRLLTKDDLKNEEEKAQTDAMEVSLMSCMDLYFFSLVHRSVEEFVAEKKWAGLEYATELLVEMTAYLLHLRTSSTALSGGLRRISLNLMGNLYFSNDPTEKLGKLLRSWQPATFSKAHLSNLASLAFYTFKLLDIRVRKDDISSDKEVAALLMLGEEFDLYGYTKKLATSDVVSLFRLLLESYNSNSLDVTHHALSFLRRLAYTTIEVERKGDAVCSFEPMMYNVPFFALCDKVLNDRHLKTSTEKVHIGLRDFCASIIRHFTKLASSNHVLFVEALFQQPTLQRIKFCQSAYTHYVNPDVVHQLNEPDYEEPTLKHISTFMKEKEDDSGEKGKAVGSEDGEEYDEVVGGVSDDEFDVDAEVTAAPKKKAKTVTSTKSNNRYPSWTPQEDDLLRELYGRFQGTRAVLELINEEMAETYKTRGVAAIRSRLVSLKLASRKALTTDADDEADDEKEGDETSTPQMNEMGNGPVHEPAETEVVEMSEVAETIGENIEVPEKKSPEKKRRLKKRSRIQKQETSPDDSDELVDSD